VESFDEVWNDIRFVLSNRSFIKTLVRDIKNDLIAIEHDHIKVRSEKTRKIRKIPRLQFEHVWNLLVVDGVYVSRAHEPYVHSQIICAILSLLDYIGVRYNPLTLLLKSFTRHQ